MGFRFNSNKKGAGPVDSGGAESNLLNIIQCRFTLEKAGGTNPALFETMASARCPVVLNVPYNLEAIENCGISFTKNKDDLKSKFEILEKNYNLVNELGNKAYNRVKQHYT